MQRMALVLAGLGLFCVSSVQAAGFEPMDWQKFETELVTKYVEGLKTAIQSQDREKFLAQVNPASSQDRAFYEELLTQYPLSAMSKVKIESTGPSAYLIKGNKTVKFAVSSLFLGEFRLNGVAFDATEYRDMRSMSEAIRKVLDQTTKAQAEFFSLFPSAHALTGVEEFAVLVVLAGGVTALLQDNGAHNDCYARAYRAREGVVQSLQDCRREIDFIRQNRAWFAHSEARQLLAHKRGVHGMPWEQFLEHSCNDLRKKYTYKSAFTVWRKEHSCVEQFDMYCGKMAELVACVRDTKQIVDNSAQAPAVTNKKGTKTIKAKEAAPPSSAAAAAPAAR